MGNKNSNAERSSSGNLLSEEEIELLLANTNFNRDTILQWFEQFKSDCPTLQLTKVEFNKIYKDFFPQGNPDKFSERVFNVFDDDKSGKISFREFLLAVSALSDSNSQNLNNKLECAFKIYDINRDGRIDRKEMEKVLTALYDLKGVTKAERTDDNAPSKIADRIFSRLNIDQNAGLSREEFVTGCSEDSTVLPMLLPN